jgi:hypothetical protein
VVRIKDYDARFAHHETLRDNTATVIATGEDVDKTLLVNGVGMTVLPPGCRYDGEGTCIDAHTTPILDTEFPIDQMITGTPNAPTLRMTLR